MEITFYGGGCVLIATKRLKLLIDPVSGEYGPGPKIKADVLLYTQTPAAASASPGIFTIDSPGEYEIKGITIDGIATRLHTEQQPDVYDGVAYTVQAGELRVLIIGNIHPELSEEQSERIGGIDALVVPVGGHGLTLDKEAAAALVRQFNPSFVVPVHYDGDGVKYPMPQDKVEDFLHEVSATDAARQDSLKIDKREGSEETTFVVLNPAS